MENIFKQSLPEIREWLRLRNDEYRDGNPTVSDLTYDAIYNYYVSKTGHKILDGEVSHGRVFNSIPMYGLEKIKTIEDLRKWIISNSLQNEKLIITPKYDGVSCGVQKTEDGVVALVKGKENMSHSISHHFSLIESDYDIDGQIVGEIIIPTKTFTDHYSSEYKNVRNMVAGKLNPRSKPSPELHDFVFMKYTSYSVDHRTKSEMLDYLNTHNKHKIPYIEATYQDLSEEYLSEIYQEFIQEFEIDGLVIDIDDLSLAEKLGRNNIGNPNFAVAYKGSFGDIRDVCIRSVKWTIDKDGVYNPTISTDLVEIDGALCGKNIYVDTAKYVRDNGIRVGKSIKIKRGGKIIPRIYEPAGYVPENPYLSYSQMISDDVAPSVCVHCSSPLLIDDSLVDISCPNPKCYGRNLQSVIFFFKTIGVVGLSNVSIKKICEDRIDDPLEQVISISERRDSVFQTLGTKVSMNILRSLEDCIRNLSIEKLMHATNLFPTMGSQKISWILDHHKVGFSEIIDWNPSISDIVSVRGIGDVQAEIFLRGLSSFKYYYETLRNMFHFTSSQTLEHMTQGDLSGRVFCFTGFRHAGMEGRIHERGGKVSPSYTKAVTDLIMKQKGSGSSKEKKAIQNGSQIWDEIEFREFLGMKTIIEEEQEKICENVKTLF